MTAAPRFSRVARMLLRSVAIGFVSVMSACVLPIAPEFQDPPAAANYAPVILLAEPQLGFIATTTPTADPPFKFTVTFSDPNVGDNLHVRWLADYPPFTLANTRTLKRDVPVSHRMDGQPLVADDFVVPSCTADNLSALAQHQIMVVIADRPFDDSPQPAGAPVDLTRVQDNGLKVIGSWILNLECQPQP
jgi:hypothetical protein